MTLLAPKAPPGLLGMDAVVINRPSANAGLTAVTYPQIDSGRATLGVPTARDLIYAEETDRATVVDLTMSFPLVKDWRVDDQVVTVRGTFVIVYVEVRRLHKRALLRRVGR